MREANETKRPFARWSDTRLVVVLVVLAALVRLVYQWESSASPAFRIPVLDSQNYDIYARQLVGGGGLTPDLFWQPVFYPLALAGLYTLSDCSVLAAKAFQALLAGITCGLVYWLAKRVFSRGMGIGAALIVALYGPLVFYDSELLANVWAELWAVVLLALLLHAVESRRLWVLGVLGACIGLSVLTRPTFLPFGCLGLAWLAICWYRGERRWQAPVAGMCVAGAAFLVVTLPVAYLCYRSTGRPAILPTSRGYNLYLGNNPRAEETEAMPGWAVVRDRQQAAEHGFAGPWGEHEYFSGLFWRYVRTQPAAFAEGMVHKSALFITSREVPSYEDVYYQRRWSWVLSTLAWKVGPFGFPFGLLLPAACLGAVYWWRRWPWPLILFPALELGAIASAHVVGRTRTTVIPVLAIFAAAGICAAIEIWRQKRWVWASAVLPAGILLVVAMTVPGPFKLEGYHSQAEIALSIGCYRYNQLHDLQGAIEAYRQALSAQPDNACAHFNLAIAYATRGDDDAAIPHYREAVRLAPGYPDFRYNLGNALVRAGQTGEAIEQYSAALQIFPASADTHHNLAFALSVAGDPAGAIAHYREAVRLDPGFTQAWVNLSEFYERTGDLAGALTAARAAVRLAPKDASLHCRVGGLQVALGNREQAVISYTRALELDGQSGPALAGLAHLEISENPSTATTQP